MQFNCGWLFLIALYVVTPLCLSQTFGENGPIKISQPTPTRLAICTPNEKYSMEPGKTYGIRLYVRNDMENKSVGRVYVMPVTDRRISFNISKPYLSEIPATEYKYFDMNVSIPQDMPYGDYRVDFEVGTDEYDIGAYSDEIQIRVRRYSDSIQYLLLAISVIIGIVFAYRFFWFRKLNKRYKKKRK